MKGYGLIFVLTGHGGVAGMFTQLSRSNNEADLRKSTVTGVIVEVLETKETKTLALFGTSGETVPVGEPSQSVIIKVI